MLERNGPVYRIQCETQKSWVSALINVQVQVKDHGPWRDQEVLGRDAAEREVQVTDDGTAADDGIVVLDGRRQLGVGLELLLLNVRVQKGQGRDPAVLLGIGTTGGSSLFCLLGFGGQQRVRTAALADRGAVRVERALAEPKLALVVAEAVAGEAQLRVLELQAHAAAGGLVHVGVVVPAEARGAREQGAHALLLGLGGAPARAVERPGHHGHDPLAQAVAVDGGVILVIFFFFILVVVVGEVVGPADEFRGDVPVATQVQVLDGVHGGVLEGVNAEAGGKEVQVDQVPVQLLAAVLELGLVNEELKAGKEGRPFPRVTAAMPLVRPVRKQLKHVWAQVLEPERAQLGVALQVVEPRGVETCGKVRRRRGQFLFGKVELAALLSHEDANIFRVF